MAPAGEEPRIAVIIPTYGEPPAMLYETAHSVLNQDYPQDKILLFLSDDAHRPSTVEIVQRLRADFAGAEIHYHDPPRRGEADRRGDAKAGNLNSVLERIRVEYPNVTYIETRDADDLVGDSTFLRQAVGQLAADPGVAFVQTIKEAHTGPGDPFGNLEPLFYRRAMLARNAANAVFPCGSGLLWRTAALDEIGGFPTWNLVEDLQSGVEALRRGWRGLYLPIVGAVGQIAPEDIPNAIKQRGTWALDTLRLTFWGKKKGLSLRQNLQFSELGFFYLLSFAVLTFLVVPIFSLVFNLYPLVVSHLDYALHFWLFAAAVELLLAALARGLPYEALWRARQTWLGMAPIYARAALVALRYGRHRKPVYRVTRKVHQHGWYWREALPQLTLFVALLGATGYHLATSSLLRDADLGSLFWAAFFLAGLSRTVRNSWYGVQPRIAIRRWIENRPPWSPLRWVAGRVRSGVIRYRKGMG
jgi:cellulose synthase (UDP-forming)